MKSVLRILWNVLAYRIGKFQMGHLYASVSISIALNLPTLDILIRSIFALLLNWFALLLHDYCDIERDLKESSISPRTKYLSEHKSKALWGLAGLALVMLVIGFIYQSEFILVLILSGLILWIYSTWLKEIPFADVFAMTCGGISLTMAGFPLHSKLGWLLVIEIGFFSAVFQTIQSIRDYNTDLDLSITTTAVFLGPYWTICLIRSLMVLGAIYSIVFLHKWIGLILLLIPFIPYTPSKVEKYWMKVRLMFGIGWLGVLAWIFVYDRTWGLISTV